MQDLLSKHCKVMMLYTHVAFIITHSDSKTKFNSDIIGAFLPQILNVRIEAYEVTKHFNIVWDIINTNVTCEIKSNHETSTSFIFFSNYSGSIRAKNFISYMQKRY